MRLRAGGGSLEQSGHRYEITTPYPWTQQMRSVIGGTEFTAADDDSHGSVIPNHQRPQRCGRTIHDLTTVALSNTSNGRDIAG